MQRFGPVTNWGGKELTMENEEIKKVDVDGAENENPNKTGDGDGTKDVKR